MDPKTQSLLVTIYTICLLVSFSLEDLRCTPSLFYCFLSASFELIYLIEHPSWLGIHVPNHVHRQCTYLLCSKRKMANNAMYTHECALLSLCLYFNMFTGSLAKVSMVLLKVDILQYINTCIHTYSFPIKIESKLIFSSFTRLQESIFYIKRAKCQEKFPFTRLALRNIISHFGSNAFRNRSQKI